MDSLEEWGIVVDQTRVSYSQRMVRIGETEKRIMQKRVGGGRWYGSQRDSDGDGRKRGKSVSERSFDARHRHSTPLCLSFLSFSLSHTLSPPKIRC